MLLTNSNHSSPTLPADYYRQISTPWPGDPVSENICGQTLIPIDQAPNTPVQRPTPLRQSPCPSKHQLKKQYNKHVCQDIPHWLCRGQKGTEWGGFLPWIPKWLKKIKEELEGLRGHASSQGVGLTHV